MMNAKDEIADWLRDAYAMERGLEVTLKKISDGERYSPECRRAAAAHLRETRGHADTIASLLESLGANLSTVKTGLGMMTEAMKGLTTAMTRDEQLKDLLASYAMEQFEIACYRALQAAARLTDLPAVATACERIISDEEKMARTLAEALPHVVEDYLGSALKAKAA